MRALAILAVSGLLGGPVLAGERPRDAGAARACAHHGAGFVEVPGTATCIRIGGRFRTDFVTSSARPSFSRDRISGFTPSASVSADVRTETGMGTLRAYVQTRVGGGPYGGR